MATKKVKAVYRISATEQIVQFDDGTYVTRKIGENNRVISETSISAAYAQRKISGGDGLQRSQVGQSPNNVVQVVSLGRVDSLVQKQDGWYKRKSDLNDQIVSEVKITQAEANRLMREARGEPSPQPRQATPPVEQMSMDQLRGVIKNIESLSPNAQGRFIYLGETYTKAGLDRIKKQYSDRLKELEIISGESVVEAESSAGMRLEQSQAEIDRVGRLLVEITTRIEDFRSAAEKAEKVSAQNNLRSWQQFYTSQANRLQTYVNNLRSGSARVGDVDTNVSLLSVQQASNRPVTSGGTPQPGVAYGGMPTGMAQPAAATTPVGGNAPVPGVAYGGMGVATPSEPFPDLSGVNFPAGTPTTPPSTTTPVGVTPSGGGMGAQPTGPSYTEPATGVTYQPGQQIGGEDRVLPNGGAVVDGIYIPPGIDYAAIGATMQIPADWEKAAREMFGVWYDVFKDDPEMSAFIQRLMREPEMSDEMFMAELQKTNWWRTTNATARDYARRQIEDPATLGTEIQNQKAQLRQLALDRGFTVNEAALDDAALKMVQFGFSQQIALNHLGQLTLEAAQGPSGLVRGYYGQSIREISAQFGVPLSETTLTKWAGDLATGNQTLASFEAYARDLAKNLYPTLTGGFDRGLSFGQMTDPYAQVASRILEIPATQVDFTDPKWAQAFTMKNEKGEQVPMSFGEWSDYLRTNPSFGYEYTDEAVNKAYSVVNQLAELFGRA